MKELPLTGHPITWAVPYEWRSGPEAEQKAPEFKREFKSATIGHCGFTGFLKHYNFMMFIRGESSGFRHVLGGQPFVG